MRSRVSLPQVGEFKYLRVLFTSEGWMEHENDRRICAVSAVMHSLHWTVVVKKELSGQAKLLIYQSIYNPPLTCHHDLCHDQKAGSWIQGVKMSIFHRVAVCSLRDRVRSSVTWEELGVEPLLFHVKRNQLRWLDHLLRLPPGVCSGHVPLAGVPREEDMLEGLCLSAGVRTPQDPPKRTEGRVFELGILGVSAQAAASMT